MQDPSKFAVAVAAPVATVATPSTAAAKEEKVDTEVCDDEDDETLFGLFDD